MCRCLRLAALVLASLAIAQGLTSVLLDDFNKKTQGPHPNVEAVLLKSGAKPWVPPVRPDPTATIKIGASSDAAAPGSDERSNIKP